MLKTLPEDDAERAVSVIDKVTKYFSAHEDLKKKLFDKKLSKSIPNYVFKTLVQSQATRNLVAAELKKMPACKNIPKEDLETTL